MKKQDVIKLTSTSRIARFESREHYERYKKLLPSIFMGVADPRSIGCEYDESHGNLALTAGLDVLCLLLIGNVNCQPYGATSRILVGDGTTPAAQEQTALQGENQAAAVMTPGYPMVDQPRAVLFQASFSEDEANFAWEEWGIDNGVDAEIGSGFGEKLLNRKVEYRGTKNGGVWVIQTRVQLG
ncbi:MAG: hypothetical protein PHZ19_05715 [Candidatus Thermoplasmatota archaeon]|nr:hypothetical protein [Candidatus Thermoplasmatota archaeon]